MSGARARQGALPRPRRGQHQQPRRQRDFVLPARQRDRRVIKRLRHPLLLCARPRGRHQRRPTSPTAAPGAPEVVFGSASARSMRLGSWVIAKAADAIVEKGRRVAVALLEATEEDIEFARGRFVVKTPTALSACSKSPPPCSTTAFRLICEGGSARLPTRRCRSRLMPTRRRSARSRSIPRLASSRSSAMPRSTIAAGRSTRC